MADGRRGSGRTECGEGPARGRGRMRPRGRNETRRFADRRPYQGRSGDLPVELGRRRDLLCPAGTARRTDRRTRGGGHRSGAHFLCGRRGRFRNPGGRVCPAGLCRPALVLAHASGRRIFGGGTGCGAACGASGAGPVPVRAGRECRVLPAAECPAAGVAAADHGAGTYGLERRIGGSPAAGIAGGVLETPGCAVGPCVRPGRRSGSRTGRADAVGGRTAYQTLRSPQTAATARRPGRRLRNGSGGFRRVGIRAAAFGGGLLPRRAAYECGKGTRRRLLSFRIETAL